MSTAGKLIKGMLKAKKESVMGKLGDSPYEDPMEPWSAKYAQPVKEESLNEDSLLMKYIKSLGFNPEFMSFAQRSSYARSNAFKRFKTGHTFDAEKQNIKKEETVAEGLPQTLRKVVPGYAKREIDKKMDDRKFGRTDVDKDANYYRYKKIQDKLKGQAVAEGSGQDDPYKGTTPTNGKIAARNSHKLGKTYNNPHSPKYHKDSYAAWDRDYNNETARLKKKVVEEEVEQIDEAGTGLLMSFIKSKGLNPLTMDGNQKKAYSRSSEFRIFKMRHMKETSGMGERGDDWNEEKKQVKEEADAKDVVSMDIPLLIRVLEFIREDVKTDMDLHRVVENLIDLRTEGVLTMDHYDQAVKIKAIKEEVETIDELSRETLGSYVTKVATGPSRGMTQKGTLKSIKAIGGVTKAIRKQYEKPIAELKKQDDNMELDDRLTREDLRKWFSKTDPQGDWKRIDSKGEVAGPCAREPGEPKPKCMSKEKRAELTKGERAAAVATKRKHDPVADRAGKGGKPINVSNYGKGKLSEDEVDEACWDTHKQVGMKKKGNRMVPDCRPKNEEVESIDEKNAPTNPALWSRAKSMARSKFDVYPSAYANGWASKWYKSKGGGWKSVKEETELVEGIGGIEDSPMSATNSVKAMESEQRKKNMKSARMIKSIYKKKGKNESMYDWEKTDKGGKTTTAKITLQGGTTMTGKPRDTVEIEPVLKTRPNSQNNK